LHCGDDGDDLRVVDQVDGLGQQHTVPRNVFMDSSAALIVNETLQVSDLPSMVEVCRMAMPMEEITSPILMEKTFGSRGGDAAFQCCCRDEKGALIGFIWAISFETENGRMGGIRLLAVHPKWQRLGIGSSLLKAAESYCWEQSAREISIGATPGNYLVAGVNPLYMNSTCFCESMGYRMSGITQVLSCRLVNLERFDARRDDLLKSGYQLRRAMGWDRRATDEFLSANWKECEEEIEHAFANTPPTISLCLFDNQIVGFVATEANNPGTGVFGPVYVHKDHRRKGVCRVLVAEGLKSLWARGFATSKHPWTTPTLSRFYSDELNATRERIHFIYRRTRVS